MNNEPKFYPLDEQSAYPEPVGTLDKLEHCDGAIWVHLNGKRSKLVGLQSLAFLIGNLQEIHTEVFASAEPSAPKCETCNDHGEIGGLRPDGYDSEPCPECGIPDCNGQCFGDDMMGDS